MHAQYIYNSGTVCANSAGNNQHATLTRQALFAYGRPPLSYLHTTSLPSVQQSEHIYAGRTLFAHVTLP